MPSFLARVRRILVRLLQWTPTAASPTKCWTLQKRAQKTYSRKWRSSKMLKYPTNINLISMVVFRFRVSPKKTHKTLMKRIGDRAQLWRINNRCRMGMVEIKFLLLPTRLTTTTTNMTSSSSRITKIITIRSTTTMTTIIRISSNMSTGISSTMINNSTMIKTNSTTTKIMMDIIMPTPMTMNLPNGNRKTVVVVQPIMMIITITTITTMVATTKTITIRTTITTKISMTTLHRRIRAPPNKT